MRGRQADLGEMARDALGIVRRHEAHAGRELERQHHADGDCLAVDQAVRVAGGGLQRVAEGVAEVEQGALALVALVGATTCGLGAAGDRDGLIALRPAGGDRAPVRLQPGEELRVADEAVFRHLGVAGVEDARGQRVEHAGVGEHQRRLVEGADKVFAARRVDAGLAADGGVDLREQRGRHLHDAHAAPHDRRGEAGEVADDAAAEGDDDVGALDARGEERRRPRWRGWRSSWFPRRRARSR